MTRIRNHVVWSLFALSLSGCEKDEAPTIDAESPADAAALTAEVSCDYFVRCGVPQISCTNDSSTDGDCETTFESISFDECIEGAMPLLSEGFACTELTEETVELVNDCLAVFDDAPCPSPDGRGDAIDDLGLPRICAYALDAVTQCVDEEDRATDGMTEGP